MKTAKPTTHAKPQKGVSLVEALVALVVLSVGLLGIAAMQVNALKASTSANYRAIAGIKASELADRMRANLGGVYSNAYNVNAASDCSSPPGTLCAKTTPNATAARCTPAQMATFDLYEVSCVNGVSDLPNGDFSIVCNDDVDTNGDGVIDADDADGDTCTDGSSFAITVSWEANIDVEQGLDNPDSTITMTVIPGNGS